MYRPEIFISATPGELDAYRGIVRLTLKQMGAQPVELQDYGVAYGPLEGVLNQLIGRCEAVIHLAGRAAEEEFCDCQSSGAGGADFSDLALATKLAFDMETTLGFGGQWPLLYRNVEDRSSILAYDRSLAERVHRRLELAYEAARKIVVRQQKAIEYLAGCLLMHETLEGPDLDSAIQKVKSFLA